MNKKTLRLSAIIVLVLAAIAVVAAIVFRPQATTPKAVSINTRNQPTIGHRQAKIHIVAFEDLKCFNCKRYNNTLYPKIKKQFIDTGVAKYTLINLAFVDGSMPAANAARCLYQQNKKFFFPFIEYIYRHQPPETQNWATIPTLMAYAKHIPGVDAKKLSECLINSPYTDFLTNNFRIAMKLMGGTVSTPTLYVNGRIVKPLSMPQIKRLVDAAK